MKDKIHDISTQAAWKLMEQVYDPEIPVLSVIDLGIIRDIVPLGERIEVIITPTYSGCPAMNFISELIGKTFRENGYPDLVITEQLSPAWTTDWMTGEGKDKLRAYGIAAPQPGGDLLSGSEFRAIPCPRCHSTRTELLSQFGSTPCKALYRCMDCLEPFDYFKCH